MAREFDRVAAAFSSVAAAQSSADQAETLSIIAILERHRSEVMANPSAGYFIKEWRELSGQVRNLLSADPGYREIRDRRRTRSETHQGETT